MLGSHLVILRLIQCGLYFQKFTSYCMGPKNRAGIFVPTQRKGNGGGGLGQVNSGGNGEKWVGLKCIWVVELTGLPVGFG